MPPTTEITWALFGRSSRRNGWQAWHWLSRELARRHRVFHVLDPVRVPGGHGSVLAEDDGVVEVRPVEYPLQRLAPMRALSRRWLRRALRRAGCGETPPVVTVLFPRSALGLARGLRPALTVYYATDDYYLQDDGVLDERFAAWERQAVAAARLVVAVSEAIAARITGQYRVPVRVIPNGYDEAILDSAETCPLPAAVRRPVLGFAGTLDGRRLDGALIGRLARRWPGASIVLAGPRANETDPALDALARLANVHLLPAVPVERVAALVRSFDAVLIPYRDTPVNRACCPLKAIEALALGRTVLAAPRIHELERFRPAVRFLDDAGEGADLPAGAAEPAAVRAARALTWRSRAGLLADLVLEALARGEASAG